MNENIPHPPSSPRIEQNSSPSRRKAQRQPVPPPKISAELELLKQKAINGEDLKGCDASLFPDLIVALKQQRDFLISYDLYTNSEECDRALKEVTRLNEQYLKQRTQKEIQSEIKQRLSKAKKELAEIEEKSKKIEKNLEASLQASLDQALERHQQEIEAYNQEWETEEKLRLYNRTSPQLRVLRTQALLLLNTHRYEEMRVVESQANKLEQQEADNSHLAMEIDYANGLVLLQKKHEVEIEKIKAIQSVKRGEFLAAKEYDLNISRTKIKKLENELEAASDQEKVWNGKKRRVIERTIKERTFEGSAQLSNAGKKEIDVSLFNKLKLPALGAETRSEKKKKMMLQERLKMRLSAPASPRTPKQNFERNGTYDNYAAYSSPQTPSSGRRILSPRVNRMYSPM